MIVVTGATGTVGSQVVEQLAAAGQPLRALVRDPSKADSVQRPGVEVAIGDMSKPETLGGALEGAERVFLLSPDVPGQQKLELEANVIDAAERAGVGHVVYLSVDGAGADPDFAFARWHHESEQRLERSGIAWTGLRPIAFMSNLLFAAASIKADGAFYLPAGEGKVAAVHPADIAAVAVKALTEEGHEGSAYTLTGPAALSHGEQAAQLSKVLAREVRYVDVPEPAAREAMQNDGMPGAIIEALLEFYGLVKAGRRAEVHPDVERITGRKPRSFASFAEENAQAFA